MRITVWEFSRVRSRKNFFIRFAPYVSFALLALQDIFCRFILLTRDSFFGNCPSPPIKINIVMLRRECGGLNEREYKGAGVKWKQNGCEETMICQRLADRFSYWSHWQIAILCSASSSSSANTVFFLNLITGSSSSRVSENINNKGLYENFNGRCLRVKNINSNAAEFLPLSPCFIYCVYNRTTKTRWRHGDTEHGDKVMNSAAFLLQFLTA